MSATQSKTFYQELNGLAREFGFDAKVVDELNSAMRAHTQANVRVARAEAAARAEDRVQSRIARGVFSPEARKGAVCNSCFMVKSVAGTCDNCD